MKENKIIKYESAGLAKRVGKAIAVVDKLLSLNLRPLKILYLDDHLTYSKSVGSFIQQKLPNASIKYIQNGTVALAYVLHSLYKHERIDLIITDIMHPGLNGIEFSKAVRIKETGFEKKIPILFITIHNHHTVIQKIKEISFVKYLNRDASSETIISHVLSLL